jgi:hypothetical protein
MGREDREALTPKGPLVGGLVTAYTGLYGLFGCAVGV